MAAIYIQFGLGCDTTMPLLLESLHMAVEDQQHTTGEVGMLAVFGSGFSLFAHVYQRPPAQEKGLHLNAIIQSIQNGLAHRFGFNIRRGHIRGAGARHISRPGVL